MKYCEARQARTFILRLEDGDIVHETIEQFAREKKIQSASLIILGGADDGSKLVTGPRKAREKPIVSLHSELEGVHEVTGTGTLFPDQHGHPILHMHLACGRENRTMTGCIRRGVKTWHVLEVIVTELTENAARRLPDAETGFELLTIPRPLDAPVPERVVQPR
ncbi:MAG: DNA-binding protein [Kiritimatiellae bacterium]|nr:DNA-binding protein [Kiritimatiellia bacterium]MDD4737611.1 DNA-binding protein [Kiritimatiellia bacterium]